MVKPKNGSSSIKSNLIITEVQKRPCLYDSNYPDYSDKTEKARAWSEVCEAVVPGWTLFGLEQKFNAGKEVQKRWRSIRDSYTKAYRQGKCMHTEQCAPGNRRSSYHTKQMSFLLKALQNNRKFRYSIDKYDSLSEASNSPQHIPTEEFSDKNKIDAFDKPLDLKKQTSDYGKPSEHSTPMQDKQSEYENQDKTALDLLAVINSVAAQDAKKQAEVKPDNNSILPEDHFDDDKMFLNSLIPSFKKMNDDTRLLCRIEVLKIIRYAMQGDKIFESLKLSEDHFYRSRFEHNMPRPVKEEYSGDPGKANDSSLSIVTRSADGSRPVKKRRMTSPSPAPPLTKKRGPGRPRKIRPPSSGSDVEEEPKKRGPKKRLNPESLEIRRVPSSEPSLSELEQKLRKATSIAQLETPEFMQIYNLERAKALPQIAYTPTSTVTQDIQVSVKTEPLDIEHHIH